MRVLDLVRQRSPFWCLYSISHSALSNCLLLSIGNYKSIPHLLLAASGYDLSIGHALAYSFLDCVCEWVRTVLGLSHSSSKGQPSDGIEQR